MRARFDEPNAFWAKIRPFQDGEPPEWHPLADHCADVGAVAERLLELPVWRARLSRLAGADLVPTQRARLAVLATLHDIGKLNLGFQAKGRADLGPSAGHVVEALSALTKPVFSDLRRLNAWGDAAGELMAAAICHHGRPYMWAGARATWQASRWEPRSGLDPAAGLADLLRRCEGWFPAAFAPGGPPLPASAPFGHAFAGLVMLADWIASDERFFPFADDSGDRMPFARSTAARILRELAIEVPPESRIDGSGQDPFARVVPRGLLPRPAQAVTAGLPLDPEGSIVVLEEETGGGKTEAALARFVALFDAGLVDGMFFALPTRTAATQLHRRVCEAVARAFVHPPPVALAVPGYLQVDGATGERLARFEVLWPDQERFRYRGWAVENAKRYLASAIIVGTVDQVLLSSLRVGHAHLRATALLRHLLVIDEVHASDAYMGRVLEDVLRRHRAAGGHALLLSATLGAETRARLLQPGGRPPRPTRDEARMMPYPLVSHGGARLTELPIAGSVRQRRIRLTMRGLMSSPQAVAELALGAAASGANVLVIRNTVADCIATQLALEIEAAKRSQRDLLFDCAGVPAPHHSRFSRDDRIALDRALESRLGRARQVLGSVVIATQTVQQSLDIDADFLLSDLCPSDVLLQRLGRLHRHERKRPDGFGEPCAVVLTPDDRDLGARLSDSGRARGAHGLGTVYDDLRVLEATWRLLERHPVWDIPAMNRQLVEDSLHSDVLRAIEGEGGDRWRLHGAMVMGAAFGEQRLADLNLVDWSKPYVETSFPESDRPRIPTRLGEDDRRAVFAPAMAGPFGNPVAELSLRADWAIGVSGDAAPADCRSHEGVLTFRFGSRAFVYDRLGLRPATEPPAEASHDDGP